MVGATSIKEWGVLTHLNMYANSRGAYLRTEIRPSYCSLLGQLQVRWVKYALAHTA